LRVHLAALTPTHHFLERSYGGTAECLLFDPIAATLQELSCGFYGGHVATPIEDKILGSKVSEIRDDETLMSSLSVFGR
jgi:hypothetical protein